jgi:hypothetical protein
MYPVAGIGVGDREGKEIKRSDWSACVAPGNFAANGEPATAMHFSIATLLRLSAVKFQEDAPGFPILIAVTVESNLVIVKFPTANCVFTSLALIVSWAAAGEKIAAAPHMIAMPAISRFMSPP